VGVGVDAWPWAVAVGVDAWMRGRGLAVGVGVDAWPWAVAVGVDAWMRGSHQTKKPSPMLSARV